MEIITIATFVLVIILLAQKGKEMSKPILYTMVVLLSIQAIAFISVIVLIVKSMIGGSSL